MTEKILGLCAWVIDDEGGEAVAVVSPPGNDAVFVPLVGDIERMERWRPMAQHIADTTGRDVHLVQFINRIDRDTIQGSP